MKRKKYFKTRAEALKELEIRKKLEPFSSALGVHKMHKGSRRAGWYAVCSEIEYLNTY